MAGNYRSQPATHSLELQLTIRNLQTVEHISNSMIISYKSVLYI